MKQTVPLSDGRSAVVAVSTIDSESVGLRLPGHPASFWLTTADAKAIAAALVRAAAAVSAAERKPR